MNFMLSRMILRKRFDKINVNWFWSRRKFIGSVRTLFLGQHDRYSAVEHFTRCFASTTSKEDYQTTSSILQYCYPESVALLPYSNRPKAAVYMYNLAYAQCIKSFFPLC